MAQFATRSRTHCTTIRAAQVFRRANQRITLKLEWFLTIAARRGGDWLRVRLPSRPVDVCADMRMGKRAMLEETGKTLSFVFWTIDGAAQESQHFSSLGLDGSSDT